MTIKRIESLARRMQVIEDTVAACKQFVDQQQPAHLEYKQKFSELVQISTELNDGFAAISAKRADEQKLYASALESINKSEHDRELLNLCLAQNQSKLTVLLQNVHILHFFLHQFAGNVARTCTFQSKKRLRMDRSIKKHVSSRRTIHQN
jgi:hypothetical protein